MPHLKVMRSTSLLISLLLALTAFGQPSPINRRAFALAGLASQGTPLLPPGKVFWYVANDVTNTPVSVWIDRIQGYCWYQTNALAKPTWATNAGVTFDGTQQFMYASNGNIMPVAANGAYLLVFQFADTSKDRMVLCNDYSGANVIVGKDAIDKLYSASGGKIGPIGTGIMDLIQAKTNISNQCGVFTNGIAGWNGPGTWNSDVLLTHVGSGNGNGFANVTIQEFIVWTNPMIWDASSISNVHYYATNTYPHSP